MRAPSIKLTRRLLIGIFFIVLFAVLFNYLQIWQRRARAVKTAPQILGSEMKRAAEAIEYSDYRNGILRFKIHAQRLVETTAGKSLLQGIEAHDFNPDGSVRNEIRSQNAEYDQGRKTADFSGDVRLFISRRIELRMDSLHYDLASSTGSSPDLLRLFSNQVNGTARGIRFDQKQQTLALDKQVDINLAGTWRQADGGTAPANTHARSDQAFYSETEGRILFRGNVRIETDVQALSGETVEAFIDPARKQISSLEAAGDAIYQSIDGKETQSLAGDRMVFGIRASGTLENINVSGQASFSTVSTTGQEVLRGRDIAARFDAKGLPMRVEARTDVSFQTKQANGQTRITGEQLDADFLAGTKSLQKIEIRNRARMSVNSGPGAESSELEAEEIHMNLRQVDGRSVLEKLRAEGAGCIRGRPEACARYSSRPPAKNGVRPQPARSLSASVLEMIQSGQGDFFESGSALGWVVITEDSIAGTSAAQLRKLEADNARFRFFPGGSQLRDLEADGNVKTAYHQKAGSGKGAGIDEFRTSSDKLKAVFELKSGASAIQSVSQWGNFKYEDRARSASAGRCDYDAGKEILAMRESPKISDEESSTTGDLVEYDQAGRVLAVRGRVRSVLVSGKAEGSFFGSSSSSSPGIVTAAEMRYWTETGRIRYSGKVQLLSENQQLQSETLEFSKGLERVEAKGAIRHLIMKKSSRPDQPASPATVQSSGLTYLKDNNTISYSGKVSLRSKDVDISSDTLDAMLDREGKRVEHAKANGSVLIRAGGREGKGDLADYYAEPEKFVVIGKPAEVFDPGRGRSFARRLTSNTADDTILLENK